MAGGVPRGEEQNQMSQQPSGWGPGASNTVTVAHCTLLQQLSQVRVELACVRAGGARRGLSS